MPVFDVKCSCCGAEKEVTVFHGEEMPKCSCGGEFTVLIGTPGFVINGYAERNGYSDEGMAWEDERKDSSFTGGRGNVS